MLIRTLPLPTPLTIPTEPLTPSSFAPFGAVLTNPAPDLRPSAAAASTSSSSSSLLPQGYGAVSANQGTAIQYRGLAPPLRDLYAHAPSGKGATPRTTMFVCGARELEPEREDGAGASAGSNSAGIFTVQILERHPFTTQTFIPLSSSSSSSSSSPVQYLVIVAPTLPPTSADNDLPVPEDRDATLPGRGMPDLSRVRAFLATGSQAVTYGAGTWHAPMAALGPPGSAVDFVVVQFANDEPVEDCQEVALEGGGENGSRIRVRVLGRRGEVSKL
ncbi:ureidoglycolate hydrolase [Daldinia loculata]|uniref:ureidoglycolate hydrolase n=1 Tax=Daldinia loculata TaxID=103429 RepID=UPI0020C5215C|nr:ureidoglycolate hydrolase [Daldinia loculata]KAI1649122.1 ureidoglycolate hydrolase [Daldinia loculata]